MMFQNVGKKIKILALVIYLLGIFVSVVASVYMSDVILFVSGMQEGGSFVLMLLMILGGIGISWAISMLIYGFGHLVENSEKMVRLQEDMLEKDEDYYAGEE